MLAYHNDPSIKAEILAELAAHRAADSLVQGYGYWKDGKGCAVGCTLKSGKHIEYETRFGIPIALARLEDVIFEGLPVVEAKAWPEAFMEAVQAGSDLSRVSWAFLHWILTDKAVNPGIDHPLVRDAVRASANLMADLAAGKTVLASAESAASAAWSAASAASAAWSAESAESAARSAESAESAERSAAYVLMSKKLLALLRAA